MAQMNQRPSAFPVICDSISGNLRQGQVTLEYFILFALMAVLTILGMTTTTGFNVNIRTAMRDFVNAAAAKLAN